MKFDKWEELKRFLQNGIDYKELPSCQRTTYEFTLKQMEEYEEIEKRFTTESADEDETIQP